MKRWLLLMAVVQLGTAVEAFAQCKYEVKFVVGPICSNPFPNNTPIAGYKLGESDVFAGDYYKCTERGISNPTQPFTWTPEGAFGLLPIAPGFPSGKAFDTNAAAGMTVGCFNDAPSGPIDVGVIWKENGEMVTLLPPETGLRCSAFGVNSNGVVIGYRNHANGQDRPFVWHDGELTDIMPPPPFKYGYARDIADSGWIAGEFGSLAANGRAFSWFEGELDILEPQGRGFACAARGVNSSGRVVGYTRLPSDGNSGYNLHPTLWDNGFASDLGLLPPFTRANAWGINDRGVICGRAFLSPNVDDWDTTAVMWIDGQAYRLEDKITIPDTLLIHALNINEAGQILCDALSNGDFGQAILTPIDPPVEDINGDCRVDSQDVGHLIDRWGLDDAYADLNGDHVVDGADLGLLLSGWSVEE